MSDIVERLRELEAVESELACECDCPPEATANYRYAMTCAEAADEIDRLRAALSTARADALDEAARVVTEHYQTLCAEHRLLLVNRAAAIRALKEKPNG